MTTVEPRSLIRRASKNISTLAGPEAGFPGVARRCARAHSTPSHPARNHAANARNAAIPPHSSALTIHTSNVFRRNPDPIVCSPDMTAHRPDPTADGRVMPARNEASNAYRQDIRNHATVMTIDIFTPLIPIKARPIAIAESRVHSNAPAGVAPAGAELILHFSQWREVFREWAWSGARFAGCPV